MFKKNSWQNYLRQNPSRAWRNYFPCHPIAILTLAGLMIGMAFGVSVQAKTNYGAAAGQPPPTPREILDLMSGDAMRQMGAMDILRKNPKTARRKLIRALRKKNLPAGWWRGVHRLTEFGMIYDIPFLLALRRKTKTPWERYIIAGAIDALYKPPENSILVQGLVKSFSYQSTRKPVAIKDANKGAWMLTEWSFEVLHRNGFNAALIRKLEDFKEVPHQNPLELERALAKKLGRRAWRRHRNILTLVSERIPLRVALRGKARVTLQNPLTEPLLVRASLEIWYGKFRRATKPVLIYLGPRRSHTVTFPVSAEGNSHRNHVRLHVRLSHATGEVIPVNRPLRIRFSPNLRRPG